MKKTIKHPSIYIKAWRCVGMLEWKTNRECSTVWSISFLCWAMQVKLAMARAVCKRHVDNGIVLPTNLWSIFFITYDVNNLDSHTKHSQDKFHCTALSATNNWSQENQGDKPVPIELDFSDKGVPKSLNQKSLCTQLNLVMNTCSKIWKHSSLSIT